MKILLSCSILWAGIAGAVSAGAQEVQFDAELAARYQAEAEAEAEDLLQRFQSSVKPRYQTAYEDYLYDLQLIAQTGRAPDNEALYDDLRVMNNNETFIYADSQD